MVLDAPLATAAPHSCGDRPAVASCCLVPLQRIPLLVINAISNWPMAHSAECRSVTMPVVQHCLPVLQFDEQHPGSVWTEPRPCRAGQWEPHHDRKCIKDVLLGDLNCGRTADKWPCVQLSKPISGPSPLSTLAALLPVQVGELVNHLGMGPLHEQVGLQLAWQAAAEGRPWPLEQAPGLQVRGVQPD